MSVRKPMSKYTNFSDKSFEEKNQAIYEGIISATSKEWLANKILEKVVTITPSRKWKDSIGCPIVKIEEKSFREINGRFPLPKVVGILKQRFYHENSESL